MVDDDGGGGDSASPWATLLLALALASLSSTWRESLWAQDVEERFQDAVAVVEVEVPLQVTWKGRAVAGLTRERIRVFDRGTEREVVYFEVRRRPWTPESAGRAEGEAAAESVVPDPGNYLLIFDATMREPRRVDRWVDALRRRLEGSHDRHAVVVKGTAGFFVVSPLSTSSVVTEAALAFVAALFERDRPAMEAASERLEGSLAGDPGGLALLRSRAGLFGVGVDPGASLARRNDADLGVSLADEAGFGEDFDVSKRLIQNVTSQRVIDLADSLAALAELFGQPAGDRNVLLISSGPPQQALLTEAKINDSNAGASVRGAAREMFRAFHRLGWRIQGLPIGMGFNPGLFYLAEETGGRVYENFNQPEELLRRVDAENRVTYLVTFQVPASAFDGRWHELEVRIADLPRRARITHRPAYFAAAPTSIPR